MPKFLMALLYAFGAGCAAGWEQICRYKSYTRVVLLNVIVTLSGLLIPLFIITHTLPFNWITFVLAIIAYLWLWGNVAYSGVRAMKGLYGGRVEPILPISETEEERIFFAPGRVIGGVALSFSWTVYGFAIAYAFMSIQQPSSFNVRHELGLVPSLYFSLTTIATVGFGDITPMTDSARLLVMLEILIGMVYAISIFSIIATFVREKHSIGLPKK